MKKLRMLVALAFLLTAWPVMAGAVVMVEVIDVKTNKHPGTATVLIKSQINPKGFAVGTTGAESVLLAFEQDDDPHTVEVNKAGYKPYEINDVWLQNLVTIDDPPYTYHHLVCYIEPVMKPGASLKPKAAKNPVERAYLKLPRRGRGAFAEFERQSRERRVVTRAGPRQGASSVSQLTAGDFKEPAYYRKERRAAGPLRLNLD